MICSLAIRTGIAPSVLEQEDEQVLLTMIDLLAGPEDEEG